MRGLTEAEQKLVDRLNKQTMVISIAAIIISCATIVINFAR